MLDFLIFAVFFLFVLICAIIYLYPGASKRATTIPGPEPLDDLEGNLPDIKACGSLHEFLLDVHADYGPIVSFYMGPQLTVSLGSPELFKQHAKVFDRPASLFELFLPLMGPDSIQYANHGEGRNRHATYTRCFSDEATKNYYHLFQKFAEDLVHTWSAEAKETHLPLRQYMFAFAIKSMLRAAYGTYFDDDKEVLKLRQAYDVCWNDLEGRLFGDQVVAGSVREERFEEHKAIMYGIMQKVVDERRQNPPEAGSPRLFVDVLIEMNNSEAVKKSDMISVLIGGFHTTGLLLTWALYFMASHPEVQDTVYQELESQLPGDQPVTADNVHKLKYLRQVLDETLRCSALAPIAARVQDMDVEIGGHKIPAKTPVVHSLGTVLQDPNLYPEPEKFDPERFSPEQVKSRPSFSFEPFGFAGKRKCPGYKLSYAEAPVLMSTLLRKFKVDLVPGQMVTSVFGLVSAPKEEIWVTVSPRK